MDKSFRNNTLERLDPVGALFFGVPSMIDSWEVQVLFTT